MPRSIIYVAVFLIVFGYKCSNVRLASNEGMTGGLVSSAMFGLVPLVILFFFFQWSDSQKAKQKARDIADAEEEEKTAKAAAIQQALAEKKAREDTERAERERVRLEAEAAQAQEKQQHDDWVAETGYGRHYAQFVTQDDKTVNSGTNSEHYANGRTVDQALGGSSSNDRDVFLKNCVDNLMLDQSAHDQQKHQEIFEKLIVPFCPAGYLYVGGGLYWNKQGHVLSVGGTRSGKGTCLIVPTLLNPLLQIDAPNTPSFVVLDPKGENLAITGRYLKEAGYNLVVINPFDIPQVAQFGSHGFNIFETFAADDKDFSDYLDMITYGLIPRSDDKDGFWKDSARNIIRLYIRHMMTQDEAQKNFRTLYKWLILGGDQRLDLLGTMTVNPAFDGDVSDRALAITHQLTAGAAKTIEGYYEQLQTSIEFLADRPVTKWLSQNDFNLKQIAKQKTALFLCLEPSKLKSMQPFMRIVIGATMRSLYRYYSNTRKVIMIMDEFIQMGRLEEFEVFSNFGAGIGAGITLWPIVQSLEDLQKTYPHAWQTFINNSVIRHFVKVNDNVTAEYLHKRLPIVERRSNDFSPPIRPTIEDVIREYPDMERSAQNDFFSNRVKDFIEMSKFYQSQTRRSNESLLTINQILNLSAMIVEVADCKQYTLFEKAPYYLHSHLGSDAADPNPFRN